MSIVQNLLPVGSARDTLPKRNIPNGGQYVMPSMQNNSIPTATNDSIQNQSGYDLSFLLPTDQQNQPNFFSVPGRTQPARQKMANRYQTATQYGMYDTANDVASLAKNLADRDRFVDNVTGIYNNFGSYLSDRQNDRNSIYGALQQDLLGELSGLYNQYDSSYGPQGSMTQKVNNYYDNLSDFLVRKQANQQMMQSGLASKYGLSDNARRISENDASMRGQAEILKAFQEETSMLDNINKTYNQLLDGAFQRYAGVQDEYVRGLSDSNFNSQTQLAQTLADLLANNEAVKQQMRLQEAAMAASGGSGGGIRYVPMPEVQLNEEMPQQQTAMGIPNNAISQGINFVQNLLRRRAPDNSSGATTAWQAAQQGE